MSEREEGAVERCAIEFCGFTWDAVNPDAIGARIVVGCEAIADLVAESPDPGRRRSPHVWTPLEYAGHVRDVPLNIRDRLIVAINEENPLCKGLFGASRVESGLYEGDPPALVAEEVRMASVLFARTWERIPASRRDRTMIYVYPRTADRSLSWVAAQALHEVEHHLADIRAGSPPDRDVVPAGPERPNVLPKAVIVLSEKERDQL